ncbi:hypothetical protein B0H17DRAFT_1202395 [Mycena rosella]|uniref:Uncharacterized protein n=1 Tax=Mycena rosella TaxID=1033263 RepID=A0AAD7DEA6_MYCRO|nr:hypothetical protein B0H17DRAFT_1202395 [Mycena rosella]
MLLLKKSSLLLAVMLVHLKVHILARILSSTEPVTLSQAVNAIGAFFCNDISWTDGCAHWTNLVSNRCYTLDAEHQDQVSSFGPDSGNACRLYDDYHCSSGNSIYIVYPGSGDLRTLYYDPAQTDTVNDNVNSFLCV